MRFWYFDYQHKGRPYRDALLDAGFIVDGNSPDFLLIDRERYMTSNTVPRADIQRYPNTPIIIYPHCSLPHWWYDGLVPIADNIKAVFVIGDGQKRAMNKFAPSLRVETSGWAWCEQRDYHIPPHGIRKILFAPIHPSGGRLRPEAIEANRMVMNDLIDISSDYEISVRYVGNRFRQGLRRHSSIALRQGATDGSTADIDAADLVIAEGTMMYMAIARGKPTIGINQHLPMRPNVKEGYFPHNWHKYGDNIAYPINYGSASLRELIEQAASGECWQWRRDFIGDSFVPAEFAAKVERIIDG